MIRSVSLALAFVLIGSVAWGEDWALIVPGQAPTCAKSEATCEQARYAIRMGWLVGLMNELPTRCEPRPQGCFDPASNVIHGR